MAGWSVCLILFKAISYTGSEICYTKKEPIGAVSMTPAYRIHSGVFLSKPRLQARGLWLSLFYGGLSLVIDLHCLGIGDVMKACPISASLLVITWPFPSRYHPANGIRGSGNSLYQRKGNGLKYHLTSKYRVFIFSVSRFALTISSLRKDGFQLIVSRG